MITLYPHQADALDDTRCFNRVEISGHDGLYEIDKFGNVFSVITTASRRERKMKPFLNNSGYLRIRLFDKNGKAKAYYIHRLVAEAFIPNPKDLPQVNHKDCNKLNNHFSNLEWCSQKYNIHESMRNELQRHFVTLIFNIKTNETVEFYSMREASKFLGKYPNFISLNMKKYGNDFVYGHYRIKVVI